MENRVDLKELIELFVIFTIKELNVEEEMPKLKFIFNEEARTIFETVMKYPFKKDGYWTPNCKLKDIENAMSRPKYDCPIIEVHEPLYFFNLLKEITNNQLRLYEKFNEPRIAREHCGYIMKRIWLRMGPNDFNNVEEFLDRELRFVKDETLDEYRFSGIITDFYGYPVKTEIKANRSWDESTRRMTFKIEEDSDNYHSLPSILYDISGDTCYIYAIQNERSIKTARIPKIERLLYKLNKEVENPTVHPSKVLALNLFINILKGKGIKTIKVPTLQVLSYPYHEILSKNKKERFPKKWTLEKIEETKYSDDLKEEYEWDKNWYYNIVDKEDLISESKTEKLIETVYRVLSSDNDLELVSDIDISDELIIKMNNKQKTLGGRK